MSNPTTPNIRNWTAKRSGPRMTITGTDLSGAAVKVSVDEIEASSNPPLVTAMNKKTGQVYRLS